MTLLAPVCLFYVSFVSVHSPIRENLQVDTGFHDIGGSTRSVLELAEHLSERDTVGKVDLVVRRVDDLSPTEEKVNDKLTVIRINAGPHQYVYKNSLWHYLDIFGENLIDYYRSTRGVPNIVHAHHAVSVDAAFKLVQLVNATFIFTPHSLGYMREKYEFVNEKVTEHYKTRIKAEEFGLAHADLIIACTEHEIRQQYQEYTNFDARKLIALAPGVDYDRLDPTEFDLHLEERIFTEKLAPFLSNFAKPIIYSIARAEVSKNQRTLVEVFGRSKRLREMANLILIAGCRTDLNTEGDGLRKVVTELLVEIDRHDLYGSVAYPKTHTQDDVEVFLKLAVKSRGVFVNVAFTELFGLTFLEAGAFGLPIVATSNGGAVEIIGKCKNGITVSPTNLTEIEQGIFDVLTAPDYIWQGWSDNGTRNTRSFYTWDRHCDRYLEQLQLARL